MSKWKTSKDSPEWVMDNSTGIVLGYKDRIGNVREIMQFPRPLADMPSVSAPVGFTPAGAAALPPLVSGGGIGVLSIAAPDGTAVGDTLTATPNTGWTVATYQWTRDGVDISGQTSSTYTLTLADEGALIGCRAGSPVYSALLQIPAGTYPFGYLSLNGGVVGFNGATVSFN